MRPLCELTSVSGRAATVSIGELFVRRAFVAHLVEIHRVLCSTPRDFDSTEHFLNYLTPQSARCCSAVGISIAASLTEVCL